MPHELGIFADESGERRGRSKHCPLTLVLHDQDSDIREPIGMYEEAPREPTCPTSLSIPSRCRTAATRMETWASPLAISCFTASAA